MLPMGREPPWRRPARPMAESPAPGDGSDAEAEDVETSLAGLKEITEPDGGHLLPRLVARAPTPSPADRFDASKTTTVVCIIEAMKVMNEIKAECARQDRRDPGRERRPRRVRPAPLPRRTGGAFFLTMFRRVLVANRGEIAQRIIRACRELECRDGRRVFSEADADALYLRQADETICIGAPRRRARSRTSTSPRSSRPRRLRTSTRSIRATGSWPRTRTSPRSASRARSASSVPRP